MIGADLMRAIPLAVIAILALMRIAPPLWLLLALVATLGLGSLIFSTGFSSWMPDVVGTDAVVKVNAALESSDAASTLLGPLVGGGVIQAFGAQLALGTDALSYMLSASTIAMARHASKLGAVVTYKRFDRQSTLAVVKAFLRSDGSRTLIVLIGCLAFIAGSGELLLTVIAKSILGLPAWQTGIVFGCAGAGGLVGSAVATRIFNKRERAPMALVFATFAFSCGIFAFVPFCRPLDGFWIACVANTVLDGCAAVAFVSVGAWLQISVSSEFRGTIIGVVSTFSGICRAIGVIIIGGVATAWHATAGWLLYFVAFSFCSILLARLAPLTPWLASSFAD